MQFARADATLFADTLATELSRLGRFADIKTVLVDDSAATKENILEALHRLDPFSPVHQTPNTPAAYPALAPAGPDDAVYPFFAGHGWARENRFYLIPHDLGYEGKRAAISSTPGAIGNVIAHAISDLDLESALEKIDAGQLLLVVDACNSGQALESEEKRQGPFNSKGLAQLAFDKGMYVLTAAQSYQAALENSKLGHGYLTYALVEEGLKEKKADADPHDGEVTIREWLDYAVNRVPELQAEASTKSRLLVHHDSAATPRPKDSDLQVPRAFYRVDEYRQDIVARQ